MNYALPDGTELTLPEHATGADAAAAIGPGLARAALAVKVDDQVLDLARPLPDGDGAAAPLEIVTDRSGDDALALIRHDAAHVLAAAVLDLYPGVKISIGPAIADGFYYDFEFPRRRHGDRRRLRADRGQDAGAHRRRRAVRAGGDPRAGRAGPLPRRAPGLQGRADRGPDPRRGRPDGLAVHQRQLHRPVPRASRPEHQADQVVQAAVGRRRLLAG